jgi:hypothetical protein
MGPRLAMVMLHNPSSLGIANNKKKCYPAVLEKVSRDDDVAREVTGTAHYVVRCGLFVCLFV